jgi:very-short-patch-repair endonuclease
MFYGASRNTFQNASALRKNMTLAEKVLWKELSDRKKFKAKFRRQHPIDIFIVDFYCHEFKLAIEIDGEIHMKKEIKEYDDGREHDIEKFGITILRFTNDEIFNDIKKVETQILLVVADKD